MTNWAEADIASIRICYSPRAHVVRRELLLMDGTHIYDYGVVCRCEAQHLTYFSFQTVDSALELWGIHAVSCRHVPKEVMKDA
jgi:hypothetical protein